MLSDKQLIGMRRHVRHNTYAAHVGLHLGVNPDIKLVGGDGWGAFRLIDPQAVSEAGLPHSCSTDITALASNNVLAGIEVLQLVEAARLLADATTWTHLYLAAHTRHQPMAVPGIGQHHRNGKPCRRDVGRRPIRGVAYGIRVMG